MAVSERATVLIVDDEPDVADAYAAQLRDQYDVETAYSGEAALDALDPSIDVVLLDRRMPDISGDDILERIRERDLQARVAMVTAVDPDFDITEMAFDTYLTKPVSDEELRDVVDEMLRLAEYDEQVRERFAVAEKLALLEAEKTERELATSDEYASLQERATELDTQASETVGKMSPEAFERAISRLVDDGGSPSE